MLELLLGAEGAVVSSEQMLERAWDDAVDPFTNTVRMTVSRLRAKLGDPPVIETVIPGRLPDRRIAVTLRRRGAGTLGPLRHPQTTVRWRLTLLYGGLFLVCGAALLAITYTLVDHATITQRAAPIDRHQRPGPRSGTRRPGAFDRSSRARLARRSGRPRCRRRSRGC